MSKKYIAILLAFVSLTIVVFYYGNSSSVEENTIKAQATQSKDITLTINQKSEARKKEILQVEQKKEEIVISVLNQTSYIGRTRDTTEQFTISFITDKTLVIPPTTQSEFAIPFIGKLKNNEKISDFGISLSERYMEYADFIQLEVLDQRTGKDAKCNLGFIGNLEQDTNYHIQVAYSEDYLECRLLKSEPMSEQTLAMKKKMAQPIKLSDLPPELQKKFLDNLNK